MMATVDVEFDETAYSLECLHAAAYRMIGTVSCQIEQAGSKYLCRLTPSATDTDIAALQLRFIDLVTDESLREHLSAKTEPYRNLILSLAFGALAAETTKRA